MRRPLVLAAFAALLLAFAFPAAVAALPGTVAYEPPVDAPVIDPFRPPAVFYGPGNRGLEYGTGAGTPVRAAAAGEVTFAGPIAGSWHVTVLHADGLRTSYSFLASASVRRGHTVAQGEVIGVTGSRPFHFGVRAGEVYLDPATLFGGPPHVYLVPETAREPRSEADERRALESFVHAVGPTASRVGRAALDWVHAGAGAGAGVFLGAFEARLDQLRRMLQQVRAAAHYATNGLGVGLSIRLPWRLAMATVEWYRARSTCTPPDAPVPPPRERRRVVLVGGLGSSASQGELNAAVDDVDTVALGYAPDDVLRLSYRGGTIDQHAYTAADTQVDIRASARRLRALLERSQYEHPGVPVDLIAHSQGGLVVRAFLAYEYGTLDPRLPPIRAAVTLGTPHTGADAATALDAFGGAPYLGSLLAAADAVDPAGLDPNSASVGQMSELSAFLDRLAQAPLPKGVALTSIAARGDFIVPSHHSDLPGATNVVVDAGGANAHDGLPGSAAALRATGLALRGLAPDCENLGDVLADTAVGTILSAGEDSAAATTLLVAYRLRLNSS